MTCPRLFLIATILVPTTARADDETTETAVVESGPADKKGWFQVGAGYNPDDQFVFHTGVGHDNLFGTGQRLKVTADISKIRQSLMMSHEVPDLLGTGLDLKTELFSQARTYPGFTRTGTGGAATLAKQLTPSTKIWARYRVEHVDVDLGDVNAAAKQAMAVGELGDGLLATAGAGISYSTLDTPALPLRGTRLELFGERASRSLGSDYDLIRAGGVLDHARGLGPFTLRLSGRATYVTSNDPMGVPLAHRLMHDGHRDVRGYALDAGSLVGDNAEATGRIELELPIWKRAGLSIAGWADAGLSKNMDPAWGATDSLLRRSVGLSIIWRSPIGPLRFDIAFPLDGPDRQRQYLFGLGGTF